jgi:hypothetical protein
MRASATTPHASMARPASCTTMAIGHASVRSSHPAATINSRGRKLGEVRQASAICFATGSPCVGTRTNLMSSFTAIMPPIAGHAITKPSSTMAAAHRMRVTRMSDGCCMTVLKG